MKNFIFIMILVAPFTVSWATESTVTTATVAAPATTEAAMTPVAEVTQPVLAEDQIPLKIEENKKALQDPTSSQRIFITFVIVAGLLAGTYLFVRRYKTSNSINKSNKQIKIVSQHYLGPKKSLAIIHVAGESMLIGITDSNISMIKSLSLIDDEIPQNVPNKFSDALSEDGVAVSPRRAALEQQGGTGATAAGQATFSMAQSGAEDEEDFSFSKIKDNVSKKLKNIRG